MLSRIGRVAQDDGLRVLTERVLKHICVKVKIRRHERHIDRLCACLLYTSEESANGYEQLADREFSPDGIWKKPEAVHAPEVQWGADGSEVVTEVTFPLSLIHI